MSASLVVAGLGLLGVAFALDGSSRLRRNGPPEAPEDLVAFDELMARADNDLRRAVEHWRVVRMPPSMRRPASAERRELGRVLHAHIVPDATYFPDSTGPSPSRATRIGARVLGHPAWRGKERGHWIIVTRDPIHAVPLPSDTEREWRLVRMRRQPQRRRKP